MKIKQSEGQNQRIERMNTCHLVCQMNVFAFAIITENTCQITQV